MGAYNIVLLLLQVLLTTRTQVRKAVLCDKLTNSSVVFVQAQDDPQNQNDGEDEGIRRDATQR